jgi:hypothetical protein
MARRSKEVDGVVDEEIIAEVVSQMTGVPLKRLEKEEAERLLANSRTSCTRRWSARTRRSARSRRRCAAPAAGLKDPQPPDGLVHLPRPVRVWVRRYLAKCLAEFMFGDEDAMITGHVRVHGEAQRQPSGRRASRLRRLRRGRPADRARAPPPLLGRAASTRSRRRTPTCSTCCSRSWRKAA